MNCKVIHVSGGCSNSGLAVEFQRETDKARRCFDFKLSSGQSSGRLLRPKRGANSGVVAGKDGSGEGRGIKENEPSGARKKPKTSRGTTPASMPAIPSEADSDLALKLACRLASMCISRTRCLVKCR